MQMLLHLIYTQTQRHPPPIAGVWLAFGWVGRVEPRASMAWAVPRRNLKEYDMKDYPSAAPAASDTRNEAAGIGLVKLPNGQQLEGYIILSDKNLKRLGLAEALPDGEYEVNATITLRFGRISAEVAPALDIKRVG